MTDILYSGTRTAEMFFAGLAGGYAYSIVSEGMPGLMDLLWILLAFLVVTVLVFALHRWYELWKGEPFR